MTTLREIMKGRVKTIHDTDTVAEAARRMKEFDIGSIPVVQGEKVIGMVTDRDIVVRGTAEGIDSEKARVFDVMTKDVIYVNDDQSIEEAANLMKKNQVRRLIVLNKDKKLSGIFSMGDIIQGEEELGKEITREVSKPSND